MDEGARVAGTLLRAAIRVAAAGYPVLDSPLAVDAVSWLGRCRFAPAAAGARAPDRVRTQMGCNLSCGTVLTLNCFERGGPMTERERCWLGYQRSHASARRMVLVGDHRADRRDAGSTSARMPGQSPRPTDATGMPLQRWPGPPVALPDFRSATRCRSSRPDCCFWSASPSRRRRYGKRGTMPCSPHSSTSLIWSS